MSDTYLAILSAIVPLNEQVQAALAAVVRQREYTRNTVLLEPGETCHHLYLIESGFMRGFCFRDGVNCSTWFAAENEVGTSAYSFITQQPGYEGIELMEKSVLFSIYYEELQTLYQQYPSLNLLGRLLTERYYIELEERTQSLQFQTATERYERLLIQQPKLLQRASLGQIASYLGISPETLSRIRRKR